MKIFGFDKYLLFETVDIQISKNQERQMLYQVHIANHLMIHYLTVLNTNIPYLYYNNMCSSMRLGLAMVLLAMQFTTPNLKTEMFNLHNC